MDYQQTLDYLYSQLPMFHRIGPAAYKADLNNTIALANHLGNPENQFKSIHVAGTNGKGSVAHILASVFQEAGYKTGLCTSPHLKDFRERFRINGAMISEEFVANFVTRHKSFFESLQLSFFEMTIAMTFDYFAHEKVDIAIIETGLGGRLDSTNIINPELSVITNIGFDHTSLLGNTVEAIAGEKAGIIKKGIPVVIGKCRKEAHQVFIHKAHQTNSEILFTENTYKTTNPGLISYNGLPLIKLTIATVSDGVPQNNHPFVSDDQINAEAVKPKFISREFECPLTGTYQYENISTAVAAADIINKKTSFVISDDALKSGIKNVVKNTGIRGRWQILGTNPLMICDTGHNADGLHYVMENIRKTAFRHLHFVLGIMNDKDVDEMLGILPKSDTTYYFCRPNVPRGMAASALKEFALQKGLVGEAYESVSDALSVARGTAHKDDLVFVGGSTFVVAEAI
jgi:dihydrofolate synthase / folylpolyglutamate synthase